jgi:acetyl esterase
MPICIDLATIQEVIWPTGSLRLVFNKYSGGIPVTDTYQLDAQSKAILATLDGPGIRQCSDMTPQEARDYMGEFMDRMALDPLPEIEAIEEVMADSDKIPVRLYRPITAAGGKLPVMIFFHAGGYVFGEPKGMDSFCCLIAREAGCIVASVDYRRAPEGKFPAAHDDAYAATCWIADHAGDLGIDRKRIAVAGNSSGGTLAISVASMALDRNGPKIRQMMLWYPGVGSAGDTQSMKDFSEGYFLNGGLMKWSMAHYLNSPADMQNPLIQPLLREDLSGLPPTYLMTAGFDPRRDDNKIYADRLAAAGVKTKFHCLTSTIHGCMFMLAGIDAAVEVAINSAHYLRDAFAEMDG